MRDMSSSASTSTTIVKRGGGVTSPMTSSGVSMTSPPTSGDDSKASGRCDCCPYGYHIDLGFVSYAQNVSNGFVSRQGTPTNMNPRGNDRQLMSPLGDSIFSDSLDNLMSDFEEVLAPHKELDRKMQLQEKSVHDIKNRLNSGYNSDYTTYRRGIANGNGNGNVHQDHQRRAHFEPAKPNPISRPVNLGLSASRSNTPTLNGNRNGYSTALAKTVSEIRARNSESPFPDANSRVGTPIDLGFHHQNNGNGGNNGFYPTTPSRFGSRHDELPPTPTPTFRRAPSQGDLPRGYSTLSHAPNGPNNEFASLRRGREFALPESEISASSRVRFFSASPKLPRRLAAGPVIDVESQYTYAQAQNGQKVLARTQSTSTSPTPKSPEPSTRTVGVTTGPLPAPKPCGECPALRKELQEAKKAPETCHVATSTIILDFSEKSSNTDVKNVCHVEVGTEPSALKDAGTDPEIVKLLEVETQTARVTVVDTACSPIPFETQVSENCLECLKRRDVFTRNVGVGICSINDKICMNCDKKVEETDENEAPGFQTDPKDDQKQREFEIAKANAVKKLLTNEQKGNFQRGTAVSKSARFERKKSVDDLDFIVDKKVTSPTVTPSTIPENSEALKAKVVLKKEPQVAEAPPTKCLPEPVNARIPRPKISKWATSEECAETPDEEEEAQDRLTPLRSDMRQLGQRWPRNSINNTAQQHIPYSTTASQEDISDSDAESDCSAHSDGTFEVTDDVFDAAPFEVSDRLREALENFNSSILEPGSVPEDTVEWSAKLVRHEWMKTAGRRTSRYEHVDKFVEELKNLGAQILNVVVNLGDQNGNTALHYAVSHANYAVVSSILDSGECDLDTPNRAGYTAVMLAALSQLDDELEKAVVHRLFQMGNVNAKASQHGQTALMLAVSHGKTVTTELLLKCGADVNVQDEEGSTALMCAAEHGHRELVKMLLADNTVNALLTDCDNSTALSIALENDHRDIGVIIAAYLNYRCLDISGPTSTI